MNPRRLLGSLVWSSPSRVLVPACFFVAACANGTSDSGGSANAGYGGSATSNGGSGAASTGGGQTGGSATGGGQTGGSATGGGHTGGSATGGGPNTGGSSTGGSGTLPKVDWSTAPKKPVATTCTVTPTAAPSATWANVTANLAGMASECGNLTLVSADPCSPMVIAGVAKGGLYATTNGGSSWAKIGAAANIVNRPSAIVYDPEHPDVFWESGIYNGGGVYKTTDHGATFTQLGTIGHNDLVSVDFTDASRKTLLAGGHEQKQKLYLSTDGGSSWTDIGPNLPAGSHFSSAPQVLDATHFLLGACGWGSGDCGVFMSNDAGKTWGKATTEGAVGQPLWASDGTMVWNTIWDSGAITSTDSGASWTKRGGPRKTHPLELPDGRILSVGNNSMIVSANHGQTWTNIGNALPFDPAGMTYSIPTKTFYIWHNDCGNVVLSNAIYAAGWDWQK